MKNKILFFLLLCLPGLQVAAPAAPSVSDVFGGMSEEEITNQVKMGQQFLEDLEKYGSPEEKAQFEQLLVETLNSMSEADFNDIQSIAKMVEPALSLPQPEPQAPVVTQPAETNVVAKKSASSETDDFKTMISTIIQRIDDILQKMNSSKECSVEIDSRWATKATFSLMKRQIYQLKINRLAEKLSKADLSTEEKSLVDTLKAFLKDLTVKNDSLVIEDDFGIPASREVEQKHLKKTKEILASFDSYIDELMPKLEKFLTKWDPEALQIAKEVETKTAKALKEATDATTRKASPNALPYTPSNPYGSSSSRGGGSSSSYGNNPASYADYGSGGYPGGYGDDSSFDSMRPSSDGRSGASSPAGKASPVATPLTEKKSEATDAYDSITSDIDDHLEQFDGKHVEKFNAFTNNDIAANYPQPSVNGTPPAPLDAAKASVWFNTVFDPYVKGVVETFKGKFNKEFLNASDLVESASRSIKDMTADASSKLASYSGLTSLQNRFEGYKAVLQSAKDAIENKFKDDLNKNKITDQQAIDSYTARHTEFTAQLTKEIEDKADNIIAQIELIKRKARKHSVRKK